MRTILTLYLILGSCLPLIHSEENDTESHPLRLMTYNIHAGVGNDKVFDLERIAAVIKGANPDIVALQEVDKETKRSKGIDIAKRLGKLTGMAAHFGASIEHDGGHYGNAILTKLPIEKVETIALPEKVAVEQRSVLMADLTFHGTAIRILVTHLCHREEANRVAGADLIVSQCAPEQSVSFVMGDLNALPDAATLLAFAEAGWKNPSAMSVPTYPATDPKRQIDYILPRTKGSTKVKVNEVRTVEARQASDHAPLLLVCELE